MPFLIMKAHQERFQCLQNSQNTGRGKNKTHICADNRGVYIERTLQSTRSIPELELQCVARYFAFRLFKTSMGKLKMYDACFLRGEAVGALRALVRLFVDAEHVTLHGCLLRELAATYAALELAFACVGVHVHFERTLALERLVTLLAGKRVRFPMNFLSTIKMAQRVLVDFSSFKNSCDFR